MIRKKLILLFASLILVSSGCTGVSVASAKSSSVSNAEIRVGDYLVGSASSVSIEFDTEDLVSSENNEGMSYIYLEGNMISSECDGAEVDGSVVTIIASGAYHISGSLVDGQIIVDTDDEGVVSLVLNGVDIASSTSAPIYVVNAEKVVISLVAGSDNVVSDGDFYFFDDPAKEEPNAAIFSNDDLTINGSGSLTVNASFKNGITSQDDLKVISGEIVVNAVNDGIRGRDSLAILDGDITVIAGGEGLQSNNDEDPEKGVVSIEGGSLLIVAGMDGIQAETNLIVSGGEVLVYSGGGSDISSVDSAKGLKAGVDLVIRAGTIQVDAADDAIHSDGSLSIDGGDIALMSGDDAIKAESIAIINGGEITISKSYEGIESAIIIINDGNINLVSSDDGINVSNGGGMGGESVSANNYLEINGGYLIVNAGGDGLDSNGYGTMNEGFVIVYGPTDGRNGALDINGTLVVNGGFLVAVGSSGMAQSPSMESTQYSVLEVLSSVQPAGTLIHIEGATGKEIVTIEPPKEFQSIVVSSPDLENGSTYNVSVGGSSNGERVDGLYTSGIYSPGSQISNFTISSMVTGQNSGIFTGGRGGRGR